MTLLLVMGAALVFLAIYMVSTALGDAEGRGCLLYTSPSPRDS